MENKNIEIAFQIIQEAQEKGQTKFQEAITYTLPKQLEIIPKDEYFEHYRRKLRECSDWYHKNYHLYFDFDKYSWDRLARMIKTVYDDADSGLNLPPFFASQQHAINLLSERIFIAKYLKYLKGLIDGQENKYLAQFEKVKERKAVAWTLYSEIEKEWPGTEKFTGKPAFDAIHFPKLERLYTDWTNIKPSLPKEKFLEKLKWQFQVWESEIEEKAKVWNPDKADVNQNTNLSEKWQKDNQKERLAFFREVLENKLAIGFLSALFLEPTDSPQEDEVKPAPQALTFKNVFQFGPDFSQAIKLFEGPLPDGSVAIKGENWIYEGKSEKALIVAFADVVKEKLSIRSEVSANDLAETVAKHFGVKLPKRLSRARWKHGIRKRGEAYDYSNFRKYFLTKL